MTNVITTENQNVGTTAWNVPYTTDANTTYIQAYADQHTLNAGQTINFFVSTQVAGTTYSFQIFRCGYYQGLGGCLKYTSGTNTGIAQGYWAIATQTLTNCPSAIIDSTTHLCDANWTQTDSWVVPANAVTGIYLAIFTDQNGKKNVLTFMVRGKGTEEYVVVRGVTTDQAYSDWGGNSMYSATKATKVSLNRPSVRGYGGTNFYLYEVPCVKWLESQGYSLGYYSNIDIHVSQSILLNCKVALDIGHDEYWTLEMRNAWEAAIAAKVSVAFLGANHCYWQIRLEADHNSVANRTVTCYKVTTGGANLANDPFYGVDNTRLTTNWRDAALNRPENSMIGIMYVDDGASSYPWTVYGSAPATYFAGTGLANGSSYGSDLIGGEWDTIFANGGSPSGLQTIGATSVVGVNGTHTANTAYYTAPSGALVFAAGSFHWTWALDSFRYDGSTVIAIPGMQTLFANVMGALKGPVFSMAQV